MQEVVFDRFYVERDDFERYKEIEDNPKVPLKDHPEIFLLSACIGYRYNLREALVRRSQLTQKQSVTNIEFAPTIIEAFRQIAISIKEVDEEGKLRTNVLMEEYAKGGFRKLYSEILGKTEKNKENLLSYLLLHLN